MRVNKLKCFAVFFGTIRLICLVRLNFSWLGVGDSPILTCFSARSFHITFGRFIMEIYNDVGMLAWWHYAWAKDKRAVIDSWARTQAVVISAECCYIC